MRDKELKLEDVKASYSIFRKLLYTLKGQPVPSTAKSTWLLLLSQADTAGILPSAWQNKGG